MAIIPLKQTIKVERIGVVDEWGQGGTITTTTLKARIDESSKLVRNQSGVEVMGKAQILLAKLADITYDDYISYADELGRTVRQKPISIAVIRNIAGKPLLTEVIL